MLTHDDLRSVEFSVCILNRVNSRIQWHETTYGTESYAVELVVNEQRPTLIRTVARLKQLRSGKTAAELATIDAIIGRESADCETLYAGITPIRWSARR